MRSALKETVFELHPELKFTHKGKLKKRRALKASIRNAFDLTFHNGLWDLPAKLIASMPKRLQAVREARGFQIKYLINLQCYMITNIRFHVYRCVRDFIITHCSIALILCRFRG